MIDATSLLKDVAAEKVLMSTYKYPKSAKQISDATGIPLVEVYKKIRELERMGLMEREKTMVTIRGKSRHFYRSKLEDAYVFFEEGRLKVRFEVAAGMADAFRKRYIASSGRDDER